MSYCLPIKVLYLMRNLIVLFSLDYWLQPPTGLYWCAFHTGLVRSGQSCYMPYFQFAISIVLSPIYPEFSTLRGE